MDRHSNNIDQFGPKQSKGGIIKLVCLVQKLLVTTEAL